ncbi:polysaccharide biosynthesis protein [bacterium]|nr:polysaccharide biosynthesis protein [bacterium]MBU1883789.1 polysaccharide biosynthesis protein [bacterium]
MVLIDKRILNFLVIITLTVATFWWTFFIFHMPFNLYVVVVVLVTRILASGLIFKDYSLSWSKATQKTFLIKSIVYIAAFLVYIPILYGIVRLAFLASELFLYLFSINFAMYLYYYIINKSQISKSKIAVIYGAGKAGMKLEEEFRDSEYKVKYFLDDDKILQKRSIDGINIVSMQELKEKIEQDKKLDLLVITISSVSKQRIKDIYNELSPYFKAIKILPSFDEIFREESFTKQLKNISVEDLLARHPKDLDKHVIEDFIKNKIVLITGAGGSIGSEISRQCARYGAKQLILLDHSEYNLYKISEELDNFKPLHVMQSVVNKELLDKTFEKYKPEIVIHAAAYKHVPLVEENMTEAIINNVMGTKNSIDCAIEHNVKKFILISTDKAVRPTSVMGTTKRVCELYAQNVISSKKANNTEIITVRFGNVLGSSGSVIPKFKVQIKNGGPITVTHPDITRYFMLIHEACELVLQSGAIGQGGEIFILDMGEPVKIADLAKKMIVLSGNDNIKIEYIGLRAGEKLYEELLIDDSDAKTQYESITIAGRTEYDLEKLNNDIFELVSTKEKLAKLKEMVPEFDHKIN